MRITRYPTERTKKDSMENRLDDLIGNYDMFAEKYDLDDKYDWFDVIYDFVKKEIKLAQPSEEEKKK